MLKSMWKILRNTIFVGVGTVSAAQAGPLDSPDTIYVDGQPCGSFCQSYLGIHRDQRRIEQVEQMGVNPSARPPAQQHGRLAKMPAERARHIARKPEDEKMSTPVARLPENKREQSSAPAKVQAPRGKMAREKSRVADLHNQVTATAGAPPPSGESASENKPADVDARSALENNENAVSRRDKLRSATRMPSDGHLPDVSGPIALGSAELSLDKSDARGEPPASPKAVPDQRRVSDASAVPGPSPAETESSNNPERSVAMSSPSNGTSPEIESRAQPPAVERLGAASLESPKPRLQNVSPNRQQDVAMMSAPPQGISSNAETRALTSATENRVAVIMVRPEIVSISDLTSKDIAIDVRQASSMDSVRTALATAGANGTNLTQARSKALDRLLEGEVPAAVLAVLSAASAENFPNIAGFRLFRIPLAAN